MCPHCLGGSLLAVRKDCIHCREGSLAAQEAAGRTTSNLTPADRIALGIFAKPWRGVASTHPLRVTDVRRDRRANPIVLRHAAALPNGVLPSNFALSNTTQEHP